MHSHTVTEHYSSPDPALLYGLEQNRRDGHRLLMSCLEDPTLDRKSPRQDARLLWYLDLKGEKHFEPTLTIRRRADVPFNPGHKLILKDSAATFTHEMLSLKEFSIEGLLARQYLPRVRRDLQVERFLQEQGIPLPKLPRARLQAVDEEILEEWFQAKIKRINLNASKVEIKPISNIRLRKGEMIPAAQFRSTVTGSKESIIDLLEMGFGRAKNYGLGLVLINKNT